MMTQAPCKTLAALVICLAIPLLSSAGLACVVIPVADVSEAGAVTIEYESQGPTLTFDNDDMDHILLLTLGLTDRVEVELDFACGSSDGPWVRLAAQLLEETTTFPAITIGSQGIAKGETAEPYLALSKDLGTTRGHAGLLYTSRHTRGFAGIEVPLSETLGFSADYITGDENTTSAGIHWGFAENAGLSIGRIMANESSGEDTWYVCVGYETSTGE